MGSGMQFGASEGQGSGEKRAMVDPRIADNCLSSPAATPRSPNETHMQEQEEQQEDAVSPQSPKSPSQACHSITSTAAATEHTSKQSVSTKPSASKQQSGTRRTRHKAKKRSKSFKGARPGELAWNIMRCKGDWLKGKGVPLMLNIGLISGKLGDDVAPSDQPESAARAPEGAPGGTHEGPQADVAVVTPVKPTGNESIFSKPPRAHVSSPPALPHPFLSDPKPLTGFNRAPRGPMGSPLLGLSGPVNHFRGDRSNSVDLNPFWGARSNSETLLYRPMYKSQSWGSGYSTTTFELPPPVPLMEAHTVPQWALRRANSAPLAAEDDRYPKLQYGVITPVMTLQKQPPMAVQGTPQGPSQAPPQDPPPLLQSPSNMWATPRSKHEPKARFSWSATSSEMQGPRGPSWDPLPLHVPDHEGSTNRGRQGPSWGLKALLGWSSPEKLTGLYRKPAAGNPCGKSAAGNDAGGVSEHAGMSEPCTGDVADTAMPEALHTSAWPEQDLEQLGDLDEMYGEHGINVDMLL